MNMEKIIEEQIFTDEECAHLMSYAQNRNFISTKSTSYVLVSSNTSQNLEFPNKITIDVDTQLNEFLLKKLNYFGIVSLPKRITILEYNTNQELKIHTDSSEVYPHRYKTVVIQLSDESDYEGGDLCIYGKNTHITSKRKGNFVMFDSSLEHSAKKIKNGVRYSMVFWLEKKNFGISNSLI